MRMWITSQSAGGVDVLEQILAEFIRHYPSQVNGLWVGALPSGSAPVIFSAP